MKNTTQNLVINHIFDTDPDLSYLGAFSDTKGKFAVKHESDSPRSYDWFNAENVENMKDAISNYKRMLQFSNDEIHCIGIEAEAKILIPEGNDPKFGILQTIKSGGLYGIESDSAKSYLKEIEADQFSELKTVLEQLNCDLSNWEDLIKDYQVQTQY